MTNSNAKFLSFILSWVMIKKNINHCTEGCQGAFTAIWKLAKFPNNDVFQFSSQVPIRILVVIYHLKYVCQMCRRSLNPLTWINAVPCGIVADVIVNFDTWIAWQRQIFGLLFLRQNIRVVYLFITQDYLSPSLSFNVSMSFGTSNWNLAFVTSNFGLGCWLIPT